MFKIVLKTHFLIKLPNATRCFSKCYNYVSLSLALFKSNQPNLNKQSIRFINELTVTSNKLTSKKKLVKKPKVSRTQDESSLSMFKVKAFATAVNYDLDGLKNALIQSAAYDVYEPGKLLPDNCLCVKSKYQGANEIEPRHVYFFEDGSVVFWNVSNAEQYSLLEMLNKYQETPYPNNIVNDESEEMYFARIPNSNTGSHGSESNSEYSNSYNNMTKLQTRLLNGNIYFSNEYGSSNDKHILEKYAFSDAISLSVKLGIWEKSLDEFAERVEFIADDLKRGISVDLKIEQILKYLGELLTLRHSVNLHSNILAIPDFYWDRENLEYLYTQLYSHMSISKRTKLFNERLNHCVDLIQLVKQHLTDNKHTRLEWIIIGLITIEVLIGLGVLDFLKKSLLFILNVNSTSPDNK
jgi:uncharacterized Rmd1/YagE family protein